MDCRGSFSSSQGSSLISVPELTDAKRQSHSVDAYAKKCRSAFYQDENDKKPLKTLELFQYVANQYPNASQEWLHRLGQISPATIDLIIQAFPRNRLSEAGGDFAKEVLLHNQARLLSR